MDFDIVTNDFTSFLHFLSFGEYGSHFSLEENISEIEIQMIDIT